jgi:hypothetical protein
MTSKSFPDRLTARVMRMMTAIGMAKHNGADKISYTASRKGIEFMSDKFKRKDAVFFQYVHAPPFFFKAEFYTIF